MIARRTFLTHSAAALLMAGTAQTAAAKDQELTAAYNASGEELFAQFAAKPGNIVFSPYSIGTAMAMVLSGARGATEAEMAKVLKHTLPRPAMEAANANVLATLNAYDKSEVPPLCPEGTKFEGGVCKGPRDARGFCRPGVFIKDGECFAPAALVPSARLAVANALMLTKNGQLVAPDYVALLKAKYAAEVFHNAKLSDVNDWAKRKTEGKIDRILDQLDPESAAVLLNAVYFKAFWQAPFGKHSTKDADFWLASSQKVAVPMMRREGNYAVATGAGYRAIRLPYAINALGMIIVVPEKADGAAELGVRLGAGELSRLMAAIGAASAKEVALSMPRFKASYKADLVPPFKTAGMTLPFDGGRADFSGMTGKPRSEVPFAISQIAHRAVIDVQEDGTEAAAVTAIEMGAVSLRPEPEQFRVDRPFLFYLVDDATGAILFQGRISDPR